MEAELDNLPEFFKVYITQHSSIKMSIPREFLDYMGLRKTGIAEIAGLGGLVWRVKLLDDGLNLYFSDGWEDFVNGNLVRDGDFMFFKFHGDLEFSVVIYDESMCERGIMECSRGGDGIMEAKESKNMKKSKREGPMVPLEGKPAKRIATLVKPFFQKCITGTNANLSFPSAFVQEHSLSYKSYEKMVLRTTKNSSWEVNIINNRGIIILSGGWPAFARESYINVGDICKFELLERLEMMVYVTRSRKKVSGKKGK